MELSLPFTAYFVFHIGSRLQFSHGYMFLVDRICRTAYHMTYKRYLETTREGGIVCEITFSGEHKIDPRISDRVMKIDGQFFDSPVDSVFIGQLRYSACHPEIIGPYFTPTFTSFTGVSVDSQPLMLVKTFFFHVFFSSFPVWKKKLPWIYWKVNFFLSPTSISYNKTVFRRWLRSALNLRVAVINELHVGNSSSYFPDWPNMFTYRTLTMPALCVLFKCHLVACRLRTLRLMNSRELMLHRASIWTKTSYPLHGVSAGPSLPAWRCSVDIV